MEWQKVTAVVVGGGSGLGQAFAETILAAGGRVVLMDANAQALRDTAVALHAQQSKRLEQGEPSRVCSLVQDSTAPDAFHRAFELAVVNFNASVNLVVNDAAGSRQSSHFDCNTPRSWESGVAVDHIALMSSTQAAAERMTATLPHGQEGVVVNLAMVGGLVDMPFWPAYAAAKAGVLDFTRSMYPLKTTRNIRVMALCPGFVDSAAGHDLVDAFPGAMRGRCGLTPVETVTEAFVRAVEDQNNAGRCMIVLEGQVTYYEANFSDKGLSFDRWRSQVTTPAPQELDEPDEEPDPEC